MGLLRLAAPLGAFLLAASAAAQLDDTTGGDRHRDYGFDGLILSAFNDGLFGLTSGDVSGDGHADLAVINNAKARIELLIHRAPGEELEAEETELLNELPDEVHFRRQSIATEEKVSALRLGDLDLDGRADAVFTGDSAKLTVAWAGADGRFTRRVSEPFADAAGGASILGLGDLDGDGLPDVVALGKTDTAIFFTGVDGSLRSGPRLPNASPTVDALELTDVDGDGRLDLLYLVNESETPLRVRQGLPGTSFGPEIRSRLPALRGHALADVDGDGATEVLAVARMSGRAMVLRFQREAVDLAEPSLLSTPFVSALAGGTAAGRRSMALADLDGDERPELLVAEAGAARLLVHAAGRSGTFGSARSFPSLLGSAWPAVADVDGDGRPELLLAAPDEQALARAVVGDDGGLSFPALHGAPGGEVFGLSVSDQDGDGRPEVWAVTGSGKGRKKDYALKRFTGAQETLALPLEDLPADPSGLVLVDLDRDGRQDVLVTMPTEPPRLLLATGGEPAFRKLAADGPGLGILKGVAPAHLRPVDVDGDGWSELLVPGANFARALHLDATGAPVVLAQFNLDRPGARVGAATVADLDGQAPPEVLLYDETARELVLLGQSAGAARELDRLPLGDLVPEALVGADLDGDGDDDLLLWAKEAFATLVAGGARPGFSVLADYESPVKDAFLTELSAGDVNGDGGTDLVLIETRKHLVHIAALQGDLPERPDRLEHVLRFPVFEARMFESSERSSREPREVLVADATGDGHADVAMLVHDRVIVYPQEVLP